MDKYLISFIINQKITKNIFQFVGIGTKIILAESQKDALDIFNNSNDNKIIAISLIDSSIESKDLGI